jgi:hypothetical protein
MKHAFQLVGSNMFVYTGVQPRLILVDKEKTSEYLCLVSPKNIYAMAVFDPELAARMKMPKELLERAPELHLAIHAGLREVHAALFDFNQSTCLWHVYSELPPGISPYAFIYGRNWIEGVFRKCTITFDCDTYALVPQSIFDPAAGADYLSLQHGVESTSTGFVELPEAEAVICFEWPDWYANLMRVIPNARVQPQSALLVRLALAKAQTGESSFLVATSSDYVTIAGVKNKVLMLLASHEARTPEDILYHLSNAALRLQIDMEHCRIQLLEAVENGEVLELLKRYVKEIRRVEAPASIESPAITQLHYLCA